MINSHQDHNQYTNEQNKTFVKEHSILKQQRTQPIISIIINVTINILFEQLINI